MSNTQKEWISAFPMPAHDDVEQGRTYLTSQGMSLRDYFAAAALQGDWASQSAETGEFLNTTLQEQLKGRAKTYYRMADAMLAARGGAS